MAAPIRFQALQHDPREELRSRLDAAPVEHSEALLATYEVLQGLHDRGILAALKGALGASDLMVESVVDVIKTPEAIRVMRNLILLGKMLGNIEPEFLDGLARAIPEGVAKGSAARPDPPGLLSLIQKFSSKESRRGMAVAADILGSFGKSLEPHGSNIH
jgi:uncharacterized protein YjgD (DUF1641 family)